jgi:hypothetical protein
MNEPTMDLATRQETLWDELHEKQDSLRCMMEATGCPYNGDRIELSREDYEDFLEELTEDFPLMDFVCPELEAEAELAAWQYEDYNADFGMEW